MKKWTEELEEFLGKYKADIRQSAEQLMGEELPQITEELFSLFELTGNRLQYEAEYFTRRKFLAVLGMAAILEKEECGKVAPRLIEKLQQVIEEICREICWALPAHVNRAENRNWQVTVDLFASETAQTLGNLSDLLREELSTECLQLVRANVERRVFLPYFESDIPYEPWEHVHTNWNAVCAGSIGSACLHLLREEPHRLDACLERVVNALSYYIAGFAGDGTCMEGLSYFTYGMTYFVNFALELNRFTEERVISKESSVADMGYQSDLLCGGWPDRGTASCNNKIGAIAAFQSKCYFRDGRTVSFSDGDSQDKFHMGLSAALAMRFPEAKLPDFSRAAGLHDDTCYRFAALKMDLLETSAYYHYLKRQQSSSRKEISRTSDSPKSEFILLPDAQWCIGQSENGIGIACKGGNNQEPHNHNDVGHFLYETEGQLFLTDLGAGEYTREYFSDKRYDIFCNHSFSHSVPVIDGEGQRAGQEYAAVFDASPDGSVKIEMQNAYGNGVAQQCSRQLFFHRDSGVMEVEDHFRLSAGEDHLVLESLVTQIPPLINNHKILLKSKGVNIAITVEKPLACEKAAVWGESTGIEKKLWDQIHLFKGQRLRDRRNGSGTEDIIVVEYPHSNHKGIQEKVYTIL